MQELQSLPKLDAKDYEILRELDINFRQSFSKIGKKVKLSKNSVGLRFQKLQNYMLHNLVGINNGALGFIEVKVYYSFDFYNEDTEKLIIKEVKRHKSILYAARYYGVYDLSICFLVNSLEHLIPQLISFNEKFSGKITQKDMQITSKHYYFRYNFLHKVPIKDYYTFDHRTEKVVLSKSERKILLLMRYNPRMSIIELSKQTCLSPKTLSNRIKDLERKNVITGYFMTLDPAKFNHNTFKLLLQVRNIKNIDEFEKFLLTLKNIKYIVKMSGLWDYEVDFIFPTISELQEQIEIIKEKFPNSLKKMGILSFSRRIVTNSYSSFV
jgi:Lrp/AsnC family transcriptional regulator, leucine-responsive regulatory protein